MRGPYPTHGGATDLMLFLVCDVIGNAQDHLRTPPKSLNWNLVKPLDQIPSLQEIQRSEELIKGHYKYVGNSTGQMV